MPQAGLNRNADGTITASTIFTTEEIIALVETAPPEPAVTSSEPAAGVGPEAAVSPVEPTPAPEVPPA